MYRSGRPVGVVVFCSASTMFSTTMSSSTSPFVRFGTAPPILKMLGRQLIGEVLASMVGTATIRRQVATIGFTGAPSAMTAATAERSIAATEAELFRRQERANMMRQKIYCEGSLLEAVQMSWVFQDCKSFVDMPLKKDAETTLGNWDELQSAGAVDRDTLMKFVNEHFDPVEAELVECAPKDWISTVHDFDYILDANYRGFAQDLHRKWPSLYRKISDAVLLNPDRYTIIPVPHPFVVPGGRFREMYYWDSFFTIKGLIASGMMDTVRGMIENMQSLVEEFGFVPNGNRIYYLNRSQPPLLTWCVDAYYQVSNDVDFVARVLPTLRKELAFFEKYRSIRLEGWPGVLYRHHVVSYGPRPESYREDVESSEHCVNEADRRIVWGDIAAAAESGRDFSSRWFTKHGPMEGLMGGTRTSRLVPVDLNAIICGNIRIMRDLYDAIGDMDSSKLFAHEFDRMRTTIQQVLWNEDEGCWFDFDLDTMEQNRIFYDSNFFPMAAGCTHEGFDSSRVANYLRAVGALGHAGGLPNSLITTGQQWDFPNGWAPTTWILIEGLRTHGQEDMAFALAEKWLRKNFNSWKSSGGVMFEKYDVTSSCLTRTGGGGEYEMQEGFGWTNGVILDLLKTYGRQLVSLDTPCQCLYCNKANVSTPVHVQILEHVAGVAA